MFAPTLRPHAADFAARLGIICEVRAVANQKFGGTITTAGLLIGGDVLAHLRAEPPGDLVVLPRIMFDHPDTIALDDISPQDCANQLQRPVALADTMGDVWDALIGASRVIYYPGPAADGAIPLRLIDDTPPTNHLT